MNIHRMLNGVTLGIGLLAVLSTTCFATRVVHQHFKITAQQAGRIVMKRFPQGTITEKIALEDEEGTWQYSVMIRNGKTLREVMVNAKTGHIDSVEVTNAAKERDEEKADAAAMNSETTSQNSEKGD